MVVSALQLLPWQARPLQLALEQLTSSAVVVHGQDGGGQLALALNVAKAWLCEAPRPNAAVYQPACGHCPACHLIDNGYHPDLKVLVPEVLQPTLGWSHADEDAGADKAEGKKTRKPSQEIKVEAIREAVSFSQRTVSRGQAKVVVIHPADRMNTVSANTLLKTLEEPPGKVRFLLSCGGLDDLLPTVRSRCQAWHLPQPDQATVLDWLCSEGKLRPDDARSLLAAAGDSPEGALRLLELGWTADVWRRWLRDLQAGQSGVWASWPLPLIIDGLQKLCHDLARLSAGGPPRFFVDAQALEGARPDLQRLTVWAAELRQARRHAEHPWNAPLKVEALVYQARRAVAQR